MQAEEIRERGCPKESRQEGDRENVKSVGLS